MVCTEGVQITYTAKLEANNILFSYIYLVCKCFICRLPVRTRFFTYISSTLWFKKQALLNNKLDLGFCAKP